MLNDTLSKNSPQPRHSFLALRITKSYTFLKMFEQQWLRSFLVRVSIVSYEFIPFA